MITAEAHLAEYSLEIVLANVAQRPGQTRAPKTVEWDPSPRQRSRDGRRCYALGDVRQWFIDRLDDPAERRALWASIEARRQTLREILPR